MYENSTVTETSAVYTLTDTSVIGRVVQISGAIPFNTSVHQDYNQSADDYYLFFEKEREGVSSKGQKM